jgi:N-acetylglucosaminyldiphosphoundecaprenol N-acetyl-beta-D-mannosaminyltransferase
MQKDEFVPREFANPDTEPVIDAANILGVRVHCLDVARLMDIVRGWSGEDILRTIYYAHSKSLNEAYQDETFCRILNSASLTYSDGISAVWAGRYLSGLPYTKMTGADWIYDYARMAAEHGIRTYLLGSRPGIARRGAQILEEKFPGLCIVGTCDGFFQEQDEAQALLDISRTHPQVVFVGMGSPLQERWIAAHRDEIQAPVCWAVGALFDYVAGEEQRVPSWMYRLGLEWFWRFIIDPRGKWKRTLIGNPLFVLRVLRQKIYSRNRTH